MDFFLLPIVMVPLELSSLLTYVYAPQIHNHALSLHKYHSHISSPDLSSVSDLYVQLYHLSLPDNPLLLKLRRRQTELIITLQCPPHLLHSLSLLYL